MLITITLFFAIFETFAVIQDYFDVYIAKTKQHKYLTLFVRLTCALAWSLFFYLCYFKL